MNTCTNPPPRHTQVDVDKHTHARVHNDSHCLCLSSIFHGQLDALENPSQWSLGYGQKSWALETRDRGSGLSRESCRSGCSVITMHAGFRASLRNSYWMLAWCRCVCAGLRCHVDLCSVQYGFISFGVAHQSQQISWHLSYPHCSAPCLQVLTDRWVLEKQDTLSADSKQKYKVSLSHTHTHIYSPLCLIYFFTIFVFPRSNSIFYLPTHWIAPFSCIWFFPPRS